MEQNKRFKEHALICYFIQDVKGKNCMFYDKSMKPCRFIDLWRLTNTRWWGWLVPRVERVVKVARVAGVARVVGIAGVVRLTR